MTEKSKQTKFTVRTEAEVTEEKPRCCGIVMPIADMDGYEQGHWRRVRMVLETAIRDSDFHPRLVSDSEEIGVIIKKIVQNLYDDEIVVVDVSGKNPNVMFELGLRLAFDKPTIIVKDDATTYSFDISTIKHIVYRRDLRFDDVENLKKEIKTAIIATVAAKDKDNQFSPFLKHFGEIKPKTIGVEELPGMEFMMATMNEMSRKIDQIQIQSRRMNSPVYVGDSNSVYGNKISDVFGSRNRFDEFMRLIVREKIEENITEISFNPDGGKRKIFSDITKNDDISVYFKDKLDRELLYNIIDSEVDTFTSNRMGISPN